MNMFLSQPYPLKKKNPKRKYKKKNYSKKIKYKLLKKKKILIKKKILLKKKKYIIKKNIYIYILLTHPQLEKKAPTLTGSQGRLLTKKNCLSGAERPAP